MWQICIIYNITLQFSKATVSSLSKMCLSLLKRLQDLPELSFIWEAQGFLPSGFLFMVGLEPLASAHSSAAVSLCTGQLLESDSLTGPDKAQQPSLTLAALKHLSL